MRYLFPLNPYNQQRQFEKPVWVYPAHLAMYATYLRNQGHDVRWGQEGDYNYGLSVYKRSQYDKIIGDDTQIDIPFDQLPYPDRTFTDAKNKRWQRYGNYKFHPATHMMASNLCWYGKCTFCIDTAKLQSGEKRGIRSIDHVIDEIDDLIANGYKEVFDDSGTFPVGEWLDEFCTKMRQKNRYKKIKVGCNMKPVKIDYKMMGQSGFRFILVGLESANQETLDRIHKGQKANQQEDRIRQMAEAGLEPHLTLMTSYPWETGEDEQKTIDMAHRLLRKGWAKTMQASIYSKPRTKPELTPKSIQSISKVYNIYRDPRFIYRKIIDIRCWEDFTYLLRGAKLVFEEKWRALCRDLQSK